MSNFNVYSVGTKERLKMQEDGRNIVKFLCMIRLLDVGLKTLDHVDKISSFLLIKSPGSNCYNDIVLKSPICILIRHYLG